MKRRGGRFWSIFCSFEDWTGKLRLEEGSLECIRLCVFLVFLVEVILFVVPIEIPLSRMKGRF